jgi:RNA polymerase sigma factor (sigma-70 family)
MTITAEQLQLLKNGDRKAQYLLYKQCFPLLMSVCVRYKKDQQEAVAALNVGFLKILTNLDKYSIDMPFEAWIRRIMINTVIDEFRREKKFRELTVFSETIEREYPQESFDTNDAEKRFNCEQLEALMRRLPPVTQQVFNLFALDGFSHKEIGEMLEMSDGTSKWHVSLARKQLQSWLKTT